ncbi:MAG TPA: PfkB family carbohydrate kinase [Chitinophagaceae bacterium]|nr:PfkB family carbohydrate kinase [Chitinophagaceae bacterium]
MTKAEFEKLFKQFGEVKAGVIGDVMLDTYWWGSVDRISPEAPVPIVALKKKEHRLGGAANVALNVKSLGARVSMFSIIGNDDDGIILEKLFKDQGIGTEYLLKSNKRITTNKSRIISRNQQMLRLDAEITKDLDAPDEDRMIGAVEKFLDNEKPNVIIFEDYNKGVLTKNVISKVIELCNKRDVITTVDPKRRNFFEFRNSTIFKPNLKEVREAFNIIDENIGEDLLQEIHQQMKQVLSHQVSLITLSEKGIFYQGDGEAAVIPAHIRNIADVSGAGDTVIAVASVVYAATKDMHLSAEIANLAGGIVCEEVGTVPISRDKLFSEMLQLPE